MMQKIGYACINFELAGRNISVNRGMIKKTFKERGLDYVSEIAISNLTSLHEILKWNVKNKIHFYRMSSDMFPWMSEYKFTELPRYKEIKSLCSKIGKYAIDNDIRLSFHPGPFNVLCSPKSHVVKTTIRELNQHAEILDMMGLPQTPYYKINIHVGGAYGDKQSAMKRFCDNYLKLSDSAKKRVTVENDDRGNLYSTTDLYNGIYKKIKIPIVFDYLHYECNPDETDMETTLKLAVSTWPAGIKPAIHYSSSRKIEDESSIARSHACYVYEKINLYSNDIDIMLESKMFEQAVLDYRNSF